MTPTYATSVHISSILGNEAPTYVIDTSSAIDTTSKVAPRILLHMGGFTMRKLGLLVLVPVAFALTMLYGQMSTTQGASSQTSMGKMDQSSVEKIISSWPEKPREAAMKFMAKNGPPAVAAEDMLMWKQTGPWKKTIIYSKEIPHEFPEPHTDFLQQTINYRVPPEKFSDLAKYDGSVIVERTKGEMSARCDKEELNMLAINLANDVVTGKKSVSDARDFYAKTAMAFKQGKMDPYVSKLQFQPQADETATADPDKPAQKKTAMK